ncbi:MAG: hypothetical protein ACRDF4_05720 [Rhabdochlamydiaceae bacterium]
MSTKDDTKFVPLNKDTQKVVDHLKQHPTHDSATAVEEEFGAGASEEFPSEEPYLAPQDELQVTT